MKGQQRNTLTSKRERMERWAEHLKVLNRVNNDRQDEIEEQATRDVPIDSGPIKQSEEPEGTRRLT